MRALLFVLLALRCGAAGEIPNLPRIRQVNLERAANLPNFIADEITVRYRRAKGDADWRVFDHVEAEIAVRGSGEFTRQNVRRDGQPWNKPLPNLNWGVSFGDELTSLFDAKCSTTAIEVDGRIEWQGKPAAAYRYQAPPNACFGTWTTNGLLGIKKRSNPARQGRFVVDGNANPVHFEMQSIDFPKSFPGDTWTAATTYDYRPIGDQSYLLPVTYEMVLGTSTSELWKAQVEYRKHRHFEAAAKVNYQP